MMSIINSRPDYDSGFYIGEEPTEGSGDYEPENLRDALIKDHEDMVRWSKFVSIMLSDNQAE